MAHDIVWLEHAKQRLGLVPTLGGGVAAWQMDHRQGRFDLWRPWDGVNEDRYTLANFAMLPWSNRISGGGFEQGGHFRPMAPNRAGEPYPIHGDGWLQAWAIEQTAKKLKSMVTRSRVERPGIESAPKVSRTIIKEALRSRESILTLDALTDERFNLGESVAMAGIRSAMCVPIVRSV